MRRRRPTPAGIAALACLTLIAARVFGPEQLSRSQPSSLSKTVMVQHVLDGDTLETATGERVRLLGVDAPEIAHHDQPGEPFGAESRAWLSRQIQSRTVTLTIGPEATDHYGRTLAWVTLPDGTLVNEQLLQTGHARLLDRFGLPAHMEPILRKAQATAQAQRAGMWK
ncbi:MAG: thermonuclease family protein [Planctomycetaceae bacterium]